MSRLNDIGGAEGFGRIEVEPDEPPFHSEWEARVFALNMTLRKHGIYELDEMRDATERIDPTRYYGMSYYERWLTAIEKLLAEKGVLS